MSAASLTITACPPGQYGIRPSGPDQDFRNWDSIDQFHQIEKLLFQELVLAKVDREWPLQDLFENTIPFFPVVPSLAHGTPIMIQSPRPGAPTGYWDDPVSQDKANCFSLRISIGIKWTTSTSGITESKSRVSMVILNSLAVRL